ncbi:TPA_asm: hypothetical protein [Physarum slime mold MELD virus]|nr:TPA_asm: hypothetical protein [Physarum slime mold MELD virus]
MFTSEVDCRVPIVIVLIFALNAASFQYFPFFVIIITQGESSAGSNGVLPVHKKLIVQVCLIILYLGSKQIIVVIQGVCSICTVVAAPVNFREALAQPSSETNLWRLSCGLAGGSFQSVRRSKFEILSWAAHKYSTEGFLTVCFSRNHEVEVGNSPGSGSWVDIRWCVSTGASSWVCCTCTQPTHLVVSIPVNFEYHVLSANFTICQPKMVDLTVII